jgi:CRP/FNR family transcriptional regulator
LGKRLIQTERQLEDLAFKSIGARLASLLLKLADETGSDKVDGFTHQQFSEMVGTYRETVTQTLNEFRVNDLVQIERKKVILIDRAGLESVANS